ncbi:hypothetical protein [Mycobacterium terramassiliense]|uniref:hypothetical protein n=1 Tax=Mycobacterium terramassiliense TaxID=1841859 RepID=UPI00097D6FE7|nr:hypothetical protein [Mycobacterium terramassiliense]
MQLSPRPDPIGELLRGSPRKLLLAGAAMVGAGLIAANPVAPSLAATHTLAEAQHRAVQLTSGIGDVLGNYEDVASQAVINLQTLGGGAEVAIPGLLQQTGTNFSGYGGLLSAALSGAQTGLQNAVYGGWYGGDDGFVFGLFGGSVTHAGVTESGSTLQQILAALQQGNLFGAFGYYDEWALEALDHTMKPLLSPFLSTAKAGAPPTPTIPGQMLQTLTNVTETFMTYANLKFLSDALLSPEIGVTFGLLADLGKIGSDVSSANGAAALTDLLKVPADLAGDLLKGYVYPSAIYNPTGEAFTGLLNNGSLLQQLLVTWPTQLAHALAEPTTPGAAASIGSAGVELTALLGGNGITGLLSGLSGNLARMIPSALTRIVSAVVRAF